MPCRARHSASAARTFPPLNGGEVTAFLQAVEKALGLFRQPAGRRSLISCPLQFIKKPVQNKIRLSQGGGEQPPASNGIKCPGSPAGQGFRQAKREPLRPLWLNTQSKHFSSLVRNCSPARIAFFYSILLFCTPEGQRILAAYSSGFAAL